MFGATQDGAVHIPEPAPLFRLVTTRSIIDFRPLVFYVSISSSNASSNWFTVVISNSISAAV